MTSPVGAPGGRSHCYVHRHIDVGSPGSYALPFWLYLAALRRVSATVAAQFLALIPVFGMAGAAGFLGEAIADAQLLGAALVVAGLVAISATRTTGER